MTRRRTARSRPDPGIAAGAPSASIPDPAGADTARRIAWTQRIVAVAFLAGIALSHPLWVTARAYPLTPVVDGIPAIPPPFDTALLIALILSLAGAILVVGSRALLTAVLGLVAILGFTDQSRWQPWAYQYTAMLGVLACAAWTRSRPGAAEAALRTCRIIVASIYLWSGLQKTNAGFTADVVPFLLAPIFRWIPASRAFLAFGAGIMVPLFEVALTLGLLLRRTRDAAVLGAVAMHLVIVTGLAVLGHNSVVWPWNLAMVALDVALFWRTPSVGTADLVRLPRGLVHAALALLFVVMPLLSFSAFDLWDAYLSSALYSGNTIASRVYVSEAMGTRLPEAIRRLVTHEVQDGVPRPYLDLNHWSFWEMNVPFYPEPRIYRNVGKHLCRYARDPADLYLTAHGKPSWPLGHRVRKACDCAMLTEGRDCPGY